MLPMFLAPILASLAPSPIKIITKSDHAERVTREVSDAVLQVTGHVPQSAEDSVALSQQLQANPDMQAKLVSELRRIEQQELDSILADRQHARDRDVKIQEATGGNHRANIMLGMAFLAIVAIVVTLFLLYRHTPGENQNAEILGTIIGFLTGIGGMFARNIGSAFDFEFGSSRGSKNKDAEIAKLSDQVSSLQSAEPQTVVGTLAQAAADVVSANPNLTAFRADMERA